MLEYLDTYQLPSLGFPLPEYEQFAIVSCDYDNCWEFRLEIAREKLYLVCNEMGTYGQSVGDVGILPAVLGLGDWTDHPSLANEGYIPVVTSSGIYLFHWDDATCRYTVTTL